MKVEFENITKKFGNAVVVDNLNLKIKSGELMILLGPSGCGKTTTLKMLAGLETPTVGNIYIGGDKVNDLEPKDRNVAMVFQHYALYPHMNVYDNLAFPLIAQKKPEEEIRKRVREVAGICRVENFLHRKPKQLSGGEQQRVALGRAIIKNPNVFLMDEPLSNIDAKLRVEMRADLARLHRKLKTTTVYVTHDQIEAMTLGERIVVMKSGCLQQVGTPKEIFNRPANLFVAGFVGAPPMNMFEGSLTEKNGKMMIDVGGFSYRISEELCNLVKKQCTTSEVVLGVRPEDISIVNKKSGTVLARVDVLQSIGSDIYVYLRMGKKSVITRVDTSRIFTIGEKVWLKFNEKRFCIFDKRTEKIIV